MPYALMICALSFSLVSCSAPEDVAGNTEAATLSTVYASSDSVIDRTSPEQVAGFASNIFLAEITESLGSSDKRGVLETQFTATVLETFKGQTDEQVVINQGGGILDNVVYVEEGDALLTVGGQYLIAARYSPQDAWYTPVPVGGDIPVAENPSQNRSASGRPTESLDEARSRMLQAIANQIPFDGLPAPEVPQAPPPVPTPNAVPSSVVPPTTLPPTLEPPLTTGGVPAPIPPASATSTPPIVTPTP